MASRSFGTEKAPLNIPNRSKQGSHVDLKIDDLRSDAESAFTALEVEVDALQADSDANNQLHFTWTEAGEAGGGAAANTFRIVGIVTDAAGVAVSVVTDVMVRLVGGGAPTSTVVTGTAKDGDGSVELWAQTTAAGLVDFDVLEATTTDLLVEVVVDDGIPRLFMLTYA